jgi:DNA-binding HxlR family transcriptional regulator
MASRSDYAGQSCSIARALEVVGERWTLLILRDAFYGVRRFGDFVTRIGLPRAVLTNRLNALVEHEVLTRVAGPNGHDEYELTDKGTKLFPVIRDLMNWGNEFYSPAGPRRVFKHAADEGDLDPDGRCAHCGQTVTVADTLSAPGPGTPADASRDETSITAAGRTYHLLQPLRN